MVVVVEGSWGSSGEIRLVGIAFSSVRPTMCTTLSSILHQPKVDLNWGRLFGLKNSQCRVVNVDWSSDIDCVKSANKYTQPQYMRLFAGIVWTDDTTQTSSSARVVVPVPVFIRRLIITLVLRSFMEINVKTCT